MPRALPGPRLTRGHFLMAVVLVSLGYFLIWPVLLLLINSFNAATDWFVEPRRFGVDHWINAFQRPGLLRSLGNSMLIWSLTVGISFPFGVGIAWLLARTKIPCSRTLEFLFWVSYMVPSLADNHRLDHLARSRYRYDQCRIEKSLRFGAGAIQYF